jgi:hypothetical protein
MATLLPDLSIPWRQSPWVCVLDPSLLLSPYGLPITRGLADVMEVWVVRELWHILDNIQFYLQHPESIQAGVAATTANHVPIAQSEIAQTLRDLEYWRMNTDLARLNLFWIGDRPNESFLPSSVDPQLIHRWEFLAAALNKELDAHFNVLVGLDVALRDAVALSVALSSAFILTYQTPAKYRANSPPGLCLTLENWGFSCQQMDGSDPIVHLERDQLLRLLIAVGAAKFLWSGLHLAILHVVTSSGCMTSLVADRLCQTGKQENAEPETPRLWQGAQGFWYWL